MLKLFSHGSREEPIEAYKSRSSKHAPIVVLVNNSCCQDSPNHQDSDLAKKPRRSERLSHKPDADGANGANGKVKTPIITNQLPSPVTHQATGSDRDGYKEPTEEPPEGRPSQVTHRTPEESSSQVQGFSSPPQDTQAFPTSQYVDANGALSDEVQDEVKEGVWGYLFPLDIKYGGQCIVLKKRSTCPHPSDVADAVDSKKSTKNRQSATEQEESWDKSRTKGVPSGGYLIGRHPECGKTFPPLPFQRFSQPI